MKLAKTVFAGIAVSVLGVLCIGVGAAVTASGNESLNPIENTKEGTYDLLDNEGAYSHQFSFAACDVNVHTTDKESSYVAYSLNGVSNINVEDNLFEVYQQSGLSIFYWLKLTGTNEVDLFLSKECMESDSFSFLIDAGEFIMDEDVSLKSLTIVMNAGNMELKGLKTDILSIEVNAGNLEISNADVKQLDFEVNAGNLEIEFTNSQSWYTIDISQKLGDLQMSPLDFESGNNHMDGTKDGYSIEGAVNVGNVEFTFG